MKLVITTQVRENYAAHEGFNGTYYWKYKDGDIYVVPNITAAQVGKIATGGIPTLKSLIEQHSDYFEEYVLAYDVVDDDALVGEVWETPFELFYEQGRWVARRTIKNDEYGYMDRNIASKTEQYDMLEGGNRENYSAVYTMVDGGIFTGTYS